MKITPLHDRIVVQPYDAADTSKGGIIIPDSAKEKPMTGKVVAVGAGKAGEPMTIKKGDEILFGKGAGMEFEKDEKKYLIMRESDALLIL